MVTWLRLCLGHRDELQNLLGHFLCGLARHHPEHLQAARPQPPRFVRPDSPGEQHQVWLALRTEQLLRKLSAGRRGTPQKAVRQANQIVALHERSQHPPPLDTCQYQMCAICVSCCPRVGASGALERLGQSLNATPDEAVEGGA
jgi:hypothetical protein